ncbi:MAG: DNA polymerase IV [Candidatus Pacebacteria bacterium]|jgi:DNA polymerase IV (DinB-like DNA polymerase)|nr:DNA polymerase IV [bacterium]MDP6527952.1 DNA polymerase IV [Candidatus Paceibacterota bacterium]MDP6659481.1 DNA polymerase IV [Candidatus Paceibacterota bacterium]|tara:strand:+ start:11543 stop:12631 length:1089 start_codon:yes stop_codon:yes gene_type:complete
MSTGKGRIIAHIDLDAFFASVEERDNPYLKGLPVVIGSDPEGGFGRGVVSTANYKAREYGIHSALPIRKAWGFSEAARKEGKSACAFISPSMNRYSDASREIFNIVSKYTPTLMQTGIDEGSTDLSHLKTFKAARVHVENMKREIKRKTRLSCSVGIGPNRLVAKIASDFDKPNGLTVITPSKVDKFLRPLSIRDIPGIGPKAEEKLRRFKIKTVGDLQKLSWEELEKNFGKWGFSMYEKARGIDERELHEPVPRKSIGKHETFREDTYDLNFVLYELSKMARSITSSMNRKSFSGFRTVVLTVRFADFTTFTRSVTTSEVMKYTKELEAKAMKLVLPFFEGVQNPEKKAVRLVGLRIEKLI